MKKIFALLLVLCLWVGMLSVTVVAQEGAVREYIVTSPYTNLKTVMEQIAQQSEPTAKVILTCDAGAFVREEDMLTDGGYNYPGLSMHSLGTEGKTVIFTSQGDDAFTIASAEENGHISYLQLLGDCIFDNVKLDFKNSGELFANGHRVEFTENYQHANDIKVTIYGGTVDGTEVASTELVVNGGEFEFIYGGSRYRSSPYLSSAATSLGGKVTGDVSLTVGGKATTDYILGGGYYAGVGGNVNLTVESDWGKNGEIEAVTTNSQAADISDIYFTYGMGTIYGGCASDSHPSLNGNFGVEGDVTIQVKSGFIHRVYGGGNNDANKDGQAYVKGNVSVTVGDAAWGQASKTAWASDGTPVCGTGNKSKIGGNVTVTLENGAYVYTRFGLDYNGGSGTRPITWVYGAGEDIDGKVELNLKGGFANYVAGIKSGVSLGTEGSEDSALTVSISGGEVVYLCPFDSFVSNSSIHGNVAMNMSGGKVHQLALSYHNGANDKSTIYGDSTLTVTGGQLAGCQLNWGKSKFLPAITGAAQNNTLMNDPNAGVSEGHTTKVIFDGYNAQGGGLAEVMQIASVDTVVIKGGSQMAIPKSNVLYGMSMGYINTLSMDGNSTLAMSGSSQVEKEFSITEGSTLALSREEGSNNLLTVNGLATGQGGLYTIAANETWVDEIFGNASLTASTPVVDETYVKAVSGESDLELTLENQEPTLYVRHDEASDTLLTDQWTIAKQEVIPDPDPPVIPEPAPGPEDPEDTGVSDWLDTKDHRRYLEGYPEGTFGPERDMTRAEAAQMFYNLLLDQNVEIIVTFTDVPEGVWYSKAVNTLATLGMLSGVGEGRFEPNRSITRGEFTSIAMKFTSGSLDGENIFTDVQKDDWFYEAVVGSIQYGWISGYGDGTFRPNNTISRAEVTSIVNKMLSRTADEEYVDNHRDQLRVFSDVTEDHWGYHHIMEATNAHDYELSGDWETWLGLKFESADMSQEETTTLLDL